MPKPVQISQPLRQWVEATTHRSMRDQSRYAKSTGLSMPQFSILMQLHYRGHCGIGDISERFDITNAAASQLVEKLFQSGLLDRAEDPNDRRAKQVTLSAKGRELIDKSIDERFRWVDELVINLKGEEREKVKEALEILTVAAQKLDQQK